MPYNAGSTHGCEFYSPSATTAAQALLRNWRAIAIMNLLFMNCLIKIEKLHYLDV